MISEIAIQKDLQIFKSKILDLQNDITALNNKNGGRGTKPTYIFMAIIPLLVIELKAPPNGNPSDDFYWRQKSSSLNLVQIIPPVGLLYFTSKSI